MSRFSSLPVFVFFCSAPLVFADILVDQKSDRVRVEIDGKLFTEYHFTGAPHVYFYPLIGPGGEKMTRSFPMENVEGEEHDHPHHRSLWFGHGSVNGVDFWAEPNSFKTPSSHPLGQIVHKKFLEVRGGEKDGVISSENDWVSSEGVLLRSIQTFHMYKGTPQERMFDFEVTLSAGDKDVVFGDTKEGAMAIRVNESMRLKQPKNRPSGGHILNSEGQKDGDVWGKHAKWVDYSGPVDGKQVGITFLENSKNPKYPNRWHARDYGLFAANPFCEHEMEKSAAAGAGDLKIEANQSITFRYRIILHEGDAQSIDIAKRSSEYGDPSK